MKVSNTIWQLLYSRWKKPKAELIPGYTIMILVPGDLPFFLKIALETCSRQNTQHLFETLVVPDNQLKPGFVERLEEWGKEYSASPIRFVKQHPVEKLFTRYYKHAHNNYWLQVVRGINAVRTTHVLFHDVDLYIRDTDFLQRHYEACLAEGKKVRGVSNAWDSWFMEQGIDHLVATWEAIFDISWFRSFKPWQQRGQEVMVANKLHICDATYWAQCNTPPEQIGCDPMKDGELQFIHFNYVTGNYRRFQESKGPFEDQTYRLLLIRLLIDAYDSSSWHYDLPALDEFIKGTSDQSCQVTYVHENTRKQYPEFRLKLQVLLDSGLLDEQKLSIIQKEIQPFDQIFNFHLASEEPQLEALY